MTFAWRYPIRRGPARGTQHPRLPGCLHLVRLIALGTVELDLPSDLSGAASQRHFSSCVAAGTEDKLSGIVRRPAEACSLGAVHEIDGSA